MQRDLRPLTRRRAAWCVLLGCLLAGNPARAQTPGSLDAAFRPGSAVDSHVYAVVAQPDGKIVLGGYFRTVNGLLRDRVARLNADGSGDPTFDPGSGADDTVYAVALQGDGKIILGGEFRSVNGTARNYLARLNPNGSVDTTFQPILGFDANSGVSDPVRSIVVQGDGKVIVAGNFITVNGVARNRVARLNADGSLDTGFDPGTVAARNPVALALQANGKLLIGGYYATSNSLSSNRVARLNADGSLDPGFDPGSGANDDVYALALQADGKVVVGGTFRTFNGALDFRVARLVGDPVRPAAVTGGADTVRAGSAILRGSVNPLGTATASVAAGISIANLAARTTYHYRVAATSAVGTAYGADAIFTTLSVAEDWRQNYFGAAAYSGNAADAADPDGDGINNLLERALGLNPTTASVSGLPTVARDPAGRLVLTANKGPSSDNLVFAVETSADLLTWTTGGVTVLTDTSEIIQARDDAPAGPRRFLRLHVSQP